MERIEHYILIDPFNTITSGVTTYTQNVAAYLTYLGINVHVLSLHKSEDLQTFRVRIANYINKIPKENLMVEAPESLHTTSEISPDINLHIRLHGSRQFGNFLQNYSVDAEEVSKEQFEINRASIVSAPSSIAVTASKNLFHYNKKVIYYPNPIPNFSFNREILDIDYLFLGRWQPLKGTLFFEKLITQFPNLKFGIASSNPPKLKNNNLVLLKADSYISRYSALTRSKVVVLPSLFETASMVGLEALAVGCKVIAWEHLGIAEYADEPCLFKVKSWDANDLTHTIKKIDSNLYLKEFQKTHSEIDQKFKTTLNQLLVSNILHLNNMPIQYMSIDWESTFFFMNQIAINKDKAHIRSRKLRKLIKNPILFFKDTKLISALHAKGFFKKVIHAKPVKESTDFVNTIEPELLLDTKNSEHNINPEISKFGAVGRIKIKDFLNRKDGWSTAILSKECDQESIYKLCCELDKFEDFSPLRKKFIQHITVDINVNESVISILNRIDVRNKSLLAGIDSFILFNPSANIVRAVRCSGDVSKTIVVITNNDIDLTDSVADVDALVCLESYPGIHTSWKRINLINSVDDLALTLRKVVQELGPKSPDMLISLIGSPVHDPKLINFDNKRYQGVIKLKQHLVPRAESFHDYLLYFSNSIDELMVLDSIYMRYRSMCEAVERGGSPAALLESCLKDGVLFNVI